MLATTVLWKCKSYGYTTGLGWHKPNTLADHPPLRSSTPGSAHYGKHMSPEEVIDFFAPDQSSVDSVIDWLVSSGIARHRISQSTNKQVSVHSALCPDQLPLT